MESGIVDVLHKLWSWCTVETPLLIEVLRLLSSLTAQFPKGGWFVGFCILIRNSGSAVVGV